MRPRRAFFIVPCLASLLLLLGAEALAGHHQRERRRQRDGGHRLPAVTSPDYRAACGVCHFAYQPGLLPAASWRAIMGRLPEHFGEPVVLDPAQGRELEAYLTANAADRCGARLAGKIMDSLGGQTPSRVSQVPYLVRKHQDRDLPAKVSRRPGVGSLANCAACHTSAEQGDFDERNVR